MYIYNHVQSFITIKLLLWHSTHTPWLKGTPKSSPMIIHYSFGSDGESYHDYHDYEPQQWLLQVLIHLASVDGIDISQKQHYERRDLGELDSVRVEHSLEPWLF